MSHASWARWMAHFNRRFGRIFISIWIGLASLFTAAVAADSVWQFGWGYSRDDALLGLGMIGFGVVFWFFWHGMLGLIDWLNEIFFPIDRDR